MEFSPEMKRLLKIFGLSTIALVLVLSFFNQKEKSESDPSQITDASRLFFKNIRSSYYDVENREDANYTLYRLDKRLKDSTVTTIQAAIVMDWLKDKAYIFIEPQGKLATIDTIKVRYQSTEGQVSCEWSAGPKEVHLDFVQKIYPALKSDYPLEILLESEWRPFLTEEKQREALRLTFFDYFRLTEQYQLND